MIEFASNIPYCGLPPLPASIWSRWNLDQSLMLAIVLLILWHARTMQRDSKARVRWRFFVAGWSSLALALLSPLCALGVALFSARVAQHMWITMVAAPLLVLAGKAGTRPLRSVTPFSAAAAFAIVLWAWHLPAAYEATFRSDVAYWLMHATLASTAFALWQTVLRGREEQWPSRVCAGFVTVVHMALLGALITFAPRLLYQSHALSAGAWGFTPLEDQQLGGLIMWIPSGTGFVVGALAILYGMLAPASSRAAREH